MEQNKYIRHGDLCFSLIAELPKEAVEISNLVLAWGEATNHAHRLNKGKVYNFQDSLIIEVEEGAELTHEEHKTIRFSKGLYLMKRQRERDPFLENIRSVVD